MATPELVVVAGGIPELLKRLREAPTDVDIDSAAEILARAGAHGRENELEAELRRLLEAPATREAVLVSLSRHVVQELDPDLAVQLPDPAITAVPAGLELLLAAAARSGSGITTDVLEILATTPSPVLFTVRGSLWKTFFSLDRVRATRAALMFHNLHPAGLFELEQGVGIADLLLSFLEAVHQDRDAAAELLPEYEFVIGREGHVFGPDGVIVGQGLPVPPSGSGRRRILLRIREALLSMGTPAALSALLRFTRFDDEELSGAAFAADYSAIEAAPWLLPHEAFVLTVRRATMPRTWDVLARHRIGLPRDVPFLEEIKYFRLREFELEGLKEGSEPPAGVFPHSPEVRLEQQNQLAREIFRTLCASYGLDGSQLDPAMDPAGLPEVPNSDLPFHYLSIRTVEGGLIQALTSVLERGEPAPAPGDAALTARMIVGKELERRSLVLYSILAACRRTGTLKADFDLAMMDQELDQLSVMIDDPDIVRTEIVHVLQVGEAHETPGGAVIPCRAAAIQVLSRQLSFNQGFYRERVQLTCEGGETQEIEWLGAIPLPLAVPLRRHPRLLDFPGTSLMARELMAEALHAPPVLEDLDYVRRSPAQTIPYVASAIVRPDVPWQHVKDSLRLESFFGRPMEFLQSAQRENTFVPLPPPPNTPPKPFVEFLNDDAKRLLDMGMPGGVGAFIGPHIAASEEEFEKERDQIQTPLSFLLTYRVGRIAGEIMMEAARKLPDDNPCHPVDFPCHLGLIRVENLAKDRIIGQLNDMIATGRATEDYFEAWDLTPVLAGPPQGMQLRQMTISPDLKRFFATYEITAFSGQVRYTNLSGDLKLDALPSWMRSRLPQLLSMDVDVVGTTVNADARFSHMAQRLMRPTAGPLPALELLDRTGLYTSMPNTTGLSDEEISRMFRLNPLPVLGRSYEGRMRMAEMLALTEIYEIASGGKPPEPGPPLPAFVEVIRDQWRAADALVRTRAQEQARPVVEAIDRNMKKWSAEFFITVSESQPGKTSNQGQTSNQNVTFGASFSYGFYGINIATSFSGNWLISGSVSGVPLPRDLALGAAELGGVQGGAPIEDRRANADARLASVPARLAAGSAMFAPVRSLASVAAAPVGGGAPSPGIPNPVTTVTFGWNAIPPLLGPGPWADSGFANGDRPWMAHLIFGAAPKLTLEEQRAVMEAVQSGFFPKPLVEILVERRNAAVEEVNIERRLWFRTDAHPANQLMGDVANEEERDARINDFNDKAHSSFVTALARERQRLGTSRVLVDGAPAVRLTYGNNYTLMLFQYDYPLVSGRVLTRLRMMRTPFYLVEAIRQDPNGHVFEMFSTAAAGSILDSVGSRVIPPGSVLREAERVKFDEAAVKHEGALNSVIESLGMTFLDVLTPPIKKFFDDLKAWIAAQPAGEAVQDPFIPDPEGTPMLNFFPPPYEWMLRRDESVEQILTRQRTEGVGGQVRTGAVVIVAPKPVFK